MGELGKTTFLKAFGTALGTQTAMDTFVCLWYFMTLREEMPTSISRV